MLAASAVALLLPAVATPRAEGSAVVHMEQGAAWTEGARAQFYQLDQGSRLIPLAWLRALTQPDGTPFIASLPRYGYLPNPDASGTAGLPIGFTHPTSSQGPMVGMTCAACHTRQIVANGTTYRIDGGPAMADIGAFLTDLDAAVQRTLASDTTFAHFADLVLGADAADALSRDILRTEVRFWGVRFHTLAGAIPKDHPWGPARLDAFGMIFDAVAGLSLGPPPTHLLPRNVLPADAPVRYPFLWNAGRQDRTQWTGFAENGTEVLGLARSIGESYGTFGRFRPVRTPGALGALDRDYLLHNSTSFAALQTLTDLSARIGPPVWPWPIDHALADRGKAVFERAADNGGCVSCHGEASPEHPAAKDLWRTPIVDVGSDTRAWDVLSRSVETGSMTGASVPGAIEPLKPRDLAINLMRVSVAGTLVGTKAAAALAHPIGAIIATTFASSSAKGDAAAKPKRNGYEARVLHGIWAAAPYLHDGSVPTLRALLAPAGQRPRAFAVGPNYDVTSVGLSSQQPAASFKLEVTGCDDLNSGNSNCGHAYGTQLPDEDKTALLEYLKTL